MTETVKKKRIAIAKKNGLTTRLEYGFITDEEFEKSLHQFATQIGLDEESIITYTLGDEDAEAEGTVYFCPKCGSYDEYGHEPDTKLYYRKDEESGQLKPAGYYKTLTIDCSECEEVYEIHSDKFEEESQKLTAAFLDK